MFRRRLLLVALDWTRPKDPPLSLGHASILANLRKQDINVLPKSWSVNHDNFSVDSVLDFVMSEAKEETDFAIGAYVWNERYVQQILDRLKSYRFPGRIVLGGPQISYLKQDVEKFYPQVDVFIRGYAEDAIAQLMRSHENKPEKEFIMQMTRI